MSTVYGTLTVGGTWNIEQYWRHYDKSTEWISGGCFCIISQNLGAGKKKEGVEGFLVCACHEPYPQCDTDVGFLLCLHQIADLFANGDHEFAGRIMEIYRMEALERFLLARAPRSWHFCMDMEKQN